MLWRVPGASAASGSSSTCSATRPSPTSPAPSAPACAPSSTSSGTPRSAPRTTRARPPASSPPASSPSCSACRSADIGTTTFRPPYTPVAFAALAGRDRGRLFDPERVTAAARLARRAPARCSRTSGSGSAPATTRNPGRTWRPRCCASAPPSAPVSASSTAPPWARSTSRARTPATFLDLLYTNLMSSLKVGWVRYGVMCGVDGMVIDDGTVLRLAEDRFLVYTTTGGAAEVLDWMEEWLQTEWPHLRVHLTSVTEQWVDLPRGRAPLARRRSAPCSGRRRRPTRRSRSWPGGTPSLDGVPVRLARISFSGELACEVNVDRLVRGRGVGTAARRPGALRHHPVRHGDDARAARREGLPDHRAGHRRHGHPARPRPGVGGVEEEARLHRQAVASAGPTTSTRCASSWSACCRWTPRPCCRRARRSSSSSPPVELPPPPVPMLGHVTSSYRSADLDRPFALALVKGGRARIGEHRARPGARQPGPVEVTGSGARRPRRSPP